MMAPGSLVQMLPDLFNKRKEEDSLGTLVQKGLGRPIMMGQSYS